MTRILTWPSEAVPEQATGDAGGRIDRHLDLTAIHGERELLRHGFLVDVDGDGAPELITRTMNANRARALRLTTGETVWLSRDIKPYPETVQISDTGCGDIDEDGVTEIIIATYQGDLICLDARNGAVKWHRELGRLLNNSNLKIRKITPGQGKNLALTVADEVVRVALGGDHRPRFNYMKHPSLIVLDHEGNTAFTVEDYAPTNGNGHYTWPADIDDDGLCEIACCGEKELIWFDHDGTRLFALPCPGEDGHPDDVRVADWDPTRPGKEIIYLNGCEGVNVYSSRGERLQSVTFGKNMASHLQLLNVVPLPDGSAGLVGANIHSADSKLLFMNQQLEVEWALELPPDVMHPTHADWDGDGEMEIITGSVGRGQDNKQAVNACSLHVMKTDGSPLYYHQWEGRSLCFPLALADLNGDGGAELIVSVGNKDGPEGRWSLSEGAHQHLYVFRSGASDAPALPRASGFS